MKVHSINYFDAFIQVAPDCKQIAGSIPNKPGTIAALQFAMIDAAPYTLTSDDMLVAVTAARKEIGADELDLLRAELFAKGQPCLRTSPLVKSFGWGIHHDEQGRIALVGRQTDAYQAMIRDPNLKQVIGMRSKRA